ncbi:molybdopterin-dependent oxidoreductase [Kineococcus rubinsiae]|uniref:molybdopterin-dependent oxidoreductase n=1 Tax=Kineococcus rubinsiae TaxID=2609562 RepID=UPI0027E4C638|nr:molybdopterin-dependent oxidoreductase [Kineococcus rubinsiae]
MDDEQRPAPSPVTRGFTGRRRAPAAALPPGQYVTEEFPVLSAGPTPRVEQDDWRFSVTTETGSSHHWDWNGLHALPRERVEVDLHCVTRWSKFGTHWSGYSLDTLLERVETTAAYAMVHSYGGYTTNLPVADLRGGRAWIVDGYDGRPLDPVHGGPARLLVPHLYLWKSAKWVSGITLSHTEELGFWERAGYHPAGDPWREERYAL